MPNAGYYSVFGYPKSLFKPNVEAFEVTSTAFCYCNELSAASLGKATWVRTSDGRKVRIFGTPKADGFPENRVGALEAERRAIARVLETGEAKPVTKEVPTIEEFHKVFLAT